MRVFALSLCLALSAASSAQVVGVTPPAPTSADNITLSVAAPLTGFVLQPITISGSTISLTFRRIGADSVPIGETHQVTIGTLPEGTYSVVVTFIHEDDDGNVLAVVTHPPFSLAVAAGHFVPMLDPAGLGALIAVLAVVGLLAVRRT